MVVEVNNLTDIEEIRKKKLEAIRKKATEVEEQADELTLMKKEFTWADFGYDEPEWAFRPSEEMPGALDICQKRQTVALTGDAGFAMLVTDLLNRARLEELMMNKEAENNESN